jgi:hypothetical protein
MFSPSSDAEVLLLSPGAMRRPAVARAVVEAYLSARRCDKAMQTYSKNSEILQN